MPKIMKIEFEVFADQGELPFRSYVSSEPVQGNMFVLVSKLLKDDTVFFKLYTCDIKTGDATCRMERTVTQEKFKESIAVLEGDLKKVIPHVSMALQTGAAVMAGPNGPIDMKDAPIEKLLKLDELKGKFERKEITPIDFAVEAIQGHLFSPQEMAGLISSFPTEIQIQLAQRLQNELFDGNMPAPLRAMGSNLINNLQKVLAVRKNMESTMKDSGPSDRISKHL